MLNVKLEVFEGPFDLLFKLIEKHKIDIYDIPMALITEKYVEEVEAMEEKNIDNIGEFLIMAATLLKIKSKMLLPPEKDENEEDIDPRLELVSRLLEYKKYKEVTATLRQMEEESSEVAFKGNMNLLEEFKNTLDVDSFLEGVSMDTLTQAFLRIMKSEKKQEENNDDEVKKHISDTVRKRRVYTVEMQMSAIYDRLLNIDNINFDELFGEEEEKMEKVMTFLALLEMIKMKKIKVVQEEIFGNINITRADDFENGMEYNADEINVDKIDEVKETSDDDDDDDEENEEEKIDSESSNEDDE